MPYTVAERRQERTLRMSSIAGELSAAGLSMKAGPAVEALDFIRELIDGLEQVERSLKRSIVGGTG